MGTPLTNLNEQQTAIWKDRYALRDSTGLSIEADIDTTFDRVALAIALSDQEAQDFKRILTDFHFVPGGRILAGAGAESEKTFYNCYVIPVETSEATRNHALRTSSSIPGNDSREGIFDTVRTMVDIMSRGGGVGISWSTLRPSGSYLTRISGTSSGPIGWMDFASGAVGTVIQGGSRRGAAMFMLDDWHPDVLSFIEAKKTKGVIENANVSVAISNAFMKAVEDDADWTLEFPDTTEETYNTTWDGDLAAWKRDGKATRSYTTLKARDLWHRIAEAAWGSGEPGVVFIDRYNDASTANGAERIIAVNPCGEQGLGAYSVCNLGAMNLNAYVTQFEGWFVGSPIPDKVFDWKAFDRDTRTAIRFLDNVIDKTYYFVRQTEEQQKRLRRIGLGTMGLADALLRMGIRYGSQESVAFVERVFQTMKDAAIETSVQLAKEKGAARAWKDSMWERPYLAEYVSRKGMPEDSQFGARNLFWLTQAPTGTTAMLAGVNSGIEPYFNIKPWRKDRTGERYVLIPVLEALGYTDGTTSFPPHVVTTRDVAVNEHIAIQAAAQKWLDSSVSKTVNAPANATVEDAQEAYDLLWKTGCKGGTFYRDGSRAVQVLYHADPNERIAELEQQVADLTGKLNFKSRVDGSLSNEGTTSSQLEGHPSDCKGEPVFEEGCVMCHSCGWSKC